MIPTITKELVFLLEPLENFGSAKSFNELRVRLLDLGIEYHSEENFTELAGQFNVIVKLIEELRGILNERELDEKKIPTVFKKSKEVFDKLKKLKSDQAIPNDLKDFPRHLMDALFLRYLGFRQTKFAQFLELFELIETSFVEEEIEYERPKIKWKDIAKTLKNPVERLSEVYQWGTTNYNFFLFLDRLRDFLSEFGIPAYFDFANEDTKGLLKGSDDFWNKKLNIPLFYKTLEEGSSEWGISIMQVNPDESSRDSHVLFYFYGSTDVKNEFQLSDDLEFRSISNFDLTTPLGISIKPNDVKIIKIQDGTVASSVLKNQIEIRRRNENNEPLGVFGYEDGSRLDIGNIGLKIESIVAANRPIDFRVSLALENTQLVIASKNQDGFLNSILPSNGIHVNSNFSIGWSNIDGLFLGGNAGLSLEIPIHLDLKILKVHNLKLELLFGNNNLLTGNITSDFEFNLGPLLCTVEGLGISNQINIEEEGRGNLGVLDFDLSPKSPTGIGIQMDAGSLITGGGFLQFDHEEKRYAGVLALNFQSIKISAIGLITTRLPNGKDGFSMLISIGTIFNPAIQLSFGFTLNGVGGLVGIHRTKRVTELRNRIIRGSMSSFMFPKNPVRNASKIISDLRTVFPAKKNHFVLAPFVKLGWGTPTLIEADLGILVELPYKGRVILVGKMSIQLPTKKNPLVDINIDVIGDFNFAEEYIRIEGRIRNSKIVNIPFEGGFAFVVSWDRRPQFLFSIGGYHPRYKKPARFPVIPRLKATIKYGSNVNLNCEYYQAITSNSFQIGFKAILYVKKGRFRIDGHLSFDALIIYNPFHFQVGISLSVRLKYRSKRLASVRLKFNLWGPRPWRVKGYAKIKVGFIKVKARFDYAWGGKRISNTKRIAASTLLTNLINQLVLSKSWTSKLPRKVRLLENLQTTNNKGALILVHPSGTLEVRQTVLPLNRKISRYGEAVVSQSPKFTISEFQFGNASSNKVGGQKLKENFARGQYQKLTDREKISRPDFELFDSGYRFSELDDVDIGDGMTSIDSSFEDVFINKELETVSRSGPKPKMWEDAAPILGKSARAKSRYNDPETKFQLEEEIITFDEEDQYYVVEKSTMKRSMDLKLYKEEPFDSTTEAEEYLKKEELINQEEFQIITADHLTMV